MIAGLSQGIKTMRREGFWPAHQSSPSRMPRSAPTLKKDGIMKLLIAFAAVLSSAALTVPTVTDVGASGPAEAPPLAAATDKSGARNA